MRNINENKVFQERLRKLRDQKGIKRMVLSELCGLHKDAVRRFERGESEPKMSELILLADFFDVSIDFLLGRK